MIEVWIKIGVMAIALGGLALLTNKLKKGQVSEVSKKGGLKVVDRLKFGFQNEIIVLEHNNVEILLVGHQGDYRQVFKERVDFAKLSGGI